MRITAEDLRRLPSDQVASVLSSLSPEQAEELKAHYSQWFIMDEPAIKDEWCRLSGIRK